MPFEVNKDYVFYIRPDGVKQLHGPVLVAAELFRADGACEIRRFDEVKKNYVPTNEMDGKEWTFEDGCTALVENGQCRKPHADDPPTQ